MSRKAKTIREHKVRVAYSDIEKGLDPQNEGKAIVYTLNTIVDLLVDIRNNQRIVGEGQGIEFRPIVKTEKRQNNNITVAPGNISETNKGK